MLDIENTKADELRKTIGDGTRSGTHSKSFGEEVYETMEFRLGAYGSHAAHLKSVLDSTADDRSILDILVHEENPAQVLELLFALGLSTDKIEQARKQGAAAWDDATEQGYAVAACCAKAAAAMREAIYGKQPDVSDQEAAA